MGSGTSYESYYFFHTLSQSVITKANYGRIFIQPSIATNNKKFNIIFTARVSMVGFSKYSTEDPRATPQVYKPTNGYQVILEPSITARVHLAGNPPRFLPARSQQKFTGCRFQLRTCPGFDRYSNSYRPASHACVLRDTYR